MGNHMKWKEYKTEIIVTAMIGIVVISAGNAIYCIASIEDQSQIRIELLKILFSGALIGVIVLWIKRLFEEKLRNEAKNVNEIIIPKKIDVKIDAEEAEYIAKAASGYYGKSNISKADMENFYSEFIMKNLRKLKDNGWSNFVFNSDLYDRVTRLKDMKIIVK